jgi:hypothetical protein
MIRAKFADLPILIVHEDLDVNDWPTLFQASTGETLKDRNTFIVGSGTSFYEQILPRNSVDFAFSGTSFHWQRFPIPKPINREEEELASQIMAPWALPHGAYRDRFIQHAVESWTLVVKHRAAEMKVGARGVFLMMSVPMEKIADSAKTLSLLMRRLVEKKMITREEAVNMKLPIFGVSKDNLLQVLRNHGFEIESYEHFFVGDSFYPAYEKTKDVDEYARCVVDWIRAFSEPTLAGGIAESRRAAAVEMYYKMLFEEVTTRISERLNWVNYANHLVAVVKTGKPASKI